MKRAIFGFATAALLAGTASADTLLNETFDSTANFTLSTPLFDDGGSDYLVLSNAPGGADVKAYTGFDGSFLTGEDLDAALPAGSGGTLPVTVTWTINITGFENLAFSGDFAEFFDSPGDIDSSDDLSVSISIDGSPATTIIDFDGADFSSTVNGIFRLDGTGTALGNAAQNFAAPIAGTGSTLTVTLSADLDSGDEDFAVDNFIVTGDVVPEPTSLALLGLGGLLIARRRRG